MTYKIGDKVKIREDLIQGKIYGIARFVSDMKTNSGYVTVSDFRFCTTGHYYIVKENKFAYTEEMFEGFVENVNKKKRG